MHDTDQERWWATGTVCSLASKASTDWWKTTRDRSTRTPAVETGETSVMERHECARVQVGGAATDLTG